VACLYSPWCCRSIPWRHVIVLSRFEVSSYSFFALFPHFFFHPPFCVLANASCHLRPFTPSRSMSFAPLVWYNDVLSFPVFAFTRPIWRYFQLHAACRRFICTAFIEAVHQILFPFFSPFLGLIRGVIPLARAYRLLSFYSCRAARCRYGSFIHVTVLYGSATPPHDGIFSKSPCPINDLPCFAYKPRPLRSLSDVTTCASRLLSLLGHAPHPSFLLFVSITLSLPIGLHLLTLSFPPTPGLPMLPLRTILVS